MRTLLVVAAVAAGGCVDGFGGSNVQIDFSPGTPLPAPPGVMPGPNQVPGNTFFTLFAVDQEKDGQGVVIREFLHEVQRFELRQAVDLRSPCMIDVEDSPYPGIHVSGFPAKERAVTGIADPRAAPPGTDPVLIQRVLTADQRLGNAMVLQAVKAVTSASVQLYPALASACADAGGEPQLIPPPTCIDDASNARRLELCEQSWSFDRLKYEGSDKVLIAPLSGELYGFVIGANPVNGATLGGAGVFVDEVLVADAYAINWQYKDGNGDGEPDYPPSFPDDQKSVTGFRYLTGYPETRTRGVTHVPLTHPADPSISALMAIFSELDDDPVQF